MNVFIYGYPKTISWSTDAAGRTRTLEESLHVGQDTLLQIERAERIDKTWPRTCFFVYLPLSILNSHVNSCILR